MKIGVLFCRDGPAGLWAPSSEASAILAASEINASGGLLGETIELVVRDIGITEREAAAAAAAVIDCDAVDAIVAMHPSNTRNAVARTAAGQVPYIYTPQYEGGVPAKGTMAIGGTDHELLGPALAWLAEHRHAARFYLIGSDYVWARTSHVTAARLITDGGGAVVGSSILPFGTEDFSPIVEALRRTRPQVVVMFLLGLEAVRFNRVFADLGLGRHIIRLAIANDETVLYATGAANTENLFAASHYLSNVRNAGNECFRELYHDAFGDLAPPINAFGQSCYDGLHVLAGLARRAGSLDSRALQSCRTEPITCRTARQGKPQGLLSARRQVHLAAADGIDFRVIQSYQAQ